MRLSIYWHSRAEADFADHINNLARYSRATSRRFVEADHGVCQLLQGSPAIGTLVNSEFQVRACSISSFKKYVLLYHESDGQLQIVRNFHGAQNWEEVVASSTFQLGE